MRFRLPSLSFRKKKNSNGAVNSAGCVCYARLYNKKISNSVSNAGFEIFMFKIVFSGSYSILGK